VTCRGAGWVGEERTLCDPAGFEEECGVWGEGCVVVVAVVVVVVVVVVMMMMIMMMTTTPPPPPSPTPPPRPPLPFRTSPQQCGALHSTPTPAPRTRMQQSFQRVSRVWGFDVVVVGWRRVLRCEGCDVVCCVIAR